MRSKYKNMTQTITKSFEFSIRQDTPHSIQQQIIHKCYSTQKTSKPSSKKQYKSLLNSENASRSCSYAENDIKQLRKSIVQKQQKVKQACMLKKQKDQCYHRIAEKLQRDLKEMKTHDSTLAKQKLRLLETCLSNKHNRIKLSHQSQMPKYKTCRTANSSRWDKQNNYFNRKTHCRNFFVKSQNNQAQQKSLPLKERLQSRNSGQEHLSKQVLMNNFIQDQKKCEKIPQKHPTVVNKINRIKMDCQRQQAYSSNLRREIQMAKFYNQMVFHNSDKIVRRMI